MRAVETNHGQPSKYWEEEKWKKREQQFPVHAQRAVADSLVGRAHGGKARPPLQLGKLKAENGTTI